MKAKKFALEYRLIAIRPDGKRVTIARNASLQTVKGYARLLPPDHQYRIEHVKVEPPKPRHR
jgi:hypothetical protein